MFQNKDPIKLAVLSKSPAPSKALRVEPKSVTPGLSTSSISSLLKQFHCQSKSTPISSSKSSISCISPAPSTPLQRKIPGWNPPSKIGTPGSKSSPLGASPSIGLRVGLSRNFKSKPLHTSVKDV